MCRSCAEGGRRCPTTETTRRNGRAAAARYYQRGKARRKIAELADAGIPAIGDQDMPATYHQHPKDQPLNLTSASGGATNSTSSSIDKPEGALWSAPGRSDAEGNIKTAWTDWAAQEDYATSGALTELKPQPGSVIVTIDSPNDAQNLLNAYNVENPDGTKSFDWEAMRNDGIDAIHVTDNMAAQTSQHIGTDHPAGKLHEWDTASTAWLKTDRLTTTAEHTPGTYTYEPNNQGEPELQPDHDHGTYEEPERPDLNTAWDRVPNRFKPDSKKTPPAPPETQGTTGSTESTEEDTTYKYGQGQQGVKVPEGMNVLDLANTLLAGAAPRRRKAHK